MWQRLLYNLGLLNQFEKRPDESRVDYNEAITVYRKLTQGNESRYGEDMARVEASLAELGQKSSR